MEEHFLKARLKHVMKVIQYIGITYRKMFLYNPNMQKTYRVCLLL